MIAALTTSSAVTPAVVLVSGQSHIPQTPPVPVQAGKLTCGSLGCVCIHDYLFQHSLFGYKWTSMFAHITCTCMHRCSLFMGIHVGYVGVCVCVFVCGCVCVPRAYICTVSVLVCPDSAGSSPTSINQCLQPGAWSIWPPGLFVKLPHQVHNWPNVVHKPRLYIGHHP